MKTSTKAAAGAGALTAGIGIAAAFLCPLAGLAAGAYFTYGAAVGAGFTTGATVALTAAGAVGGLVLGRIAREVVAVCSLVAGAFTGIGVKLFGSLFEKKDKRNAPAQKAKPAASSSKLTGTMKISALFKASGKGPGNDNAKPTIRKAPGFQL